MVPTPYRLDAFAVTLIARLEPTRRSHPADRGAAEGAYRRIVSDAARALAEECREVMGDSAQAALIEREAVETLLPRYAELAATLNTIERPAGLAWLTGESIVGRVVMTGVAFVVALVVSRVIHHWIDALFFGAAVLTPVLPELRLWWARRRYRAELQAIADDMGRIQDAELALPGGLR